MRLRRLTSPKICIWQAGDPGELTVSFHSKSEDLRTRRANSAVQPESQQAQDLGRRCCSSRLKAGKKTNVPGQGSQIGENTLLLSLSVLFRPSTD